MTAAHHPYAQPPLGPSRGVRRRAHTPTISRSSPNGSGASRSSTSITPPPRHKPQAVIDAVTRFYSAENANIHRGVHYLSERATVAYEAVRERVARFLNAPSARQIVFTRGTTESINLVAQTPSAEARLGPATRS